MYIRVCIYVYIYILYYIHKNILRYMCICICNLLYTIYCRKRRKEFSFTRNIYCWRIFPGRTKRRRNDFGLGTTELSVACDIYSGYLDLLRTSAMFSTSDMFTRDFLLMTLPLNSSTVLSSSLCGHTAKPQHPLTKPTSENYRFRVTRLDRRAPICF